MISVLVGDPVTLAFHIAVNSDGTRNEFTGFVSFTFTSIEGNTSPETRFSRNDDSFPQQYSLSIQGTSESDAGVYRAMGRGNKHKQASKQTDKQTNKASKQIKCQLHIIFSDQTCVEEDIDISCPLVEVEITLEVICKSLHPLQQVVWISYLCFFSLL